MPRLNDRIAILTGGSGGIGRVTAERFLEEGASVVLVDLDDQALADTARALGQPERVLTVKADVTCEDDVKNYVQSTLDRFGRIDIFFNNAGIEGRVAPLVDQRVEDFDKVMAVNVRGVFLGLKHVLPEMIRERRGSIINTSSVAGLDGSPNLSPYITSKHAVTGLTKAAAIEAGPYEVRVNSIHPSPVNTRMMRSLEEGYSPGDAEEAKKGFTGAIPLGRYGESRDIANLVVFLASDDSSFITGAQYRVDGGMGAS